MPSKGSIRIDGQPVTGPLKISGMAFQAPSLLPWRTTLDNVLLPLEIVEPYRSTSRPQAQGVRGQGARAAEERGPGRLRGQVPVAALGRHAAARQHLPRAGARAQDAAARRALRRARRLHARRAVVHPARPARGAALQRHPGHARPARERVPGRHGVRHEQEPGALRGQARDRPAAPARPGDHLHPEFTDIVHELRGHIGAMRKTGVSVPQWHP
jgi:NitT/TauT family transport system ATP-binding protein